MTNELVKRESASNPEKIREFDVMDKSGRSILSKTQSDVAKKHGNLYHLE